MFKKTLLVSMLLALASLSWAQLTVNVDGVGAPDTAGGPYSKLSLAAAYVNANSSPPNVINIRTNALTDDTQINIVVPMTINGDGEAVPDGQDCVITVDTDATDGVRSDADAGATGFSYIEIEAVGDVILNDLILVPNQNGTTTKVDAVATHLPAAAGVGNYVLNRVIATNANSSGVWQNPASVTDIYYATGSRRWYAFGAASGIFYLSNTGPAGALGTYNVTLNDCMAGAGRDRGLNIQNQSGTNTINGGVFAHCGAINIYIDGATNVTFTGSDQNRVRCYAGSRGPAGGDNIRIVSGSVTLMEYLDTDSGTNGSSGLTMQGGTIAQMRHVRVGGNNDAQILLSGTGTITAAEDVSSHSGRAQFNNTANVAPYTAPYGPPFVALAGWAGSATFTDSVFTSGYLQQITINDGATTDLLLINCAIPTDGATGESLDTANPINKVINTNSTPVGTSPSYFTALRDVADPVNAGYLFPTAGAYATADSIGGFLKGGAPPATRILTIASNHGAPSPAVGAKMYLPGTALTLTVASPVNESGFDFACTGWVGSGDVPGSGATTSIPITLNNDSVTTWTWLALNAPIVINEFAYDDSGTDDREFVELYNPGIDPADISGWLVKGGDLNVDSTRTIPASTTIAAGDYYVIGMAAVPNVDQVTALTLQNDQEWIQLADASGNQVDFVAYETWNQGVGNPPAPDGVTTPTLEGVGIWGTATMADVVFNQSSAANVPSSTWARFPNGSDTDNNADDFGWLVASPGEANETYGTVTLPYTNNFDDADGTTYFDLGGSFVNTSAQDPLTSDVVGAGSVNPVVIPASPQGGNVGICWDASGGGNAGRINLINPVADLKIECYVFIDAKALASGEYESTTWFAVRGHADAYSYNTPVIFVPGANFNEGIFVSYSNANNAGSPATTRLAVDLVQKHEGVETILGTIPITAGLNDGWQRLYLNCNGADVALILGGTLGDVNSGTLVRSTSVTNIKAGGMGMGYREFITPNQNTRPWTVDGLTITNVPDVLPPNLSVDDWTVFE